MGKKRGNKKSDVMESTNTLTLKLLIDSKSNKVLFAEAPKDFVDFLFFLLSLPIGAVIKLLTAKSMAGSIGNLYRSFADLKETYLQPNLHKEVLLNPLPSSTSVANVPLLMGSPNVFGSSASTKKFYTCIYCPGSCVTDSYYLSKCSSCGRNSMTRNIHFVPSSNLGMTDTGGYVQGVVTYMISDDLKVTPMSMVSSISMMNKFKVSRLDVLQEKEVKVGSEEGLELLRMSFQSNTVLTDVFLGRKNINNRI